MLRLAVITAVAAYVSLAGCATHHDLPRTNEAQLVLGNQEVVSVNDLSCRPDGSVVATGYRVSRLGSTGGLILRSGDRGLSWQVAHDGGSMANVNTWFFEDPRDTERLPRPLFVTGYRSLGVVTTASSLFYAMGPWLMSPDNGQTWVDSKPVAPFGSSRTMGEPDVQRLLVVDQVGTLAFTRVQRGLNPWKEWSVLLMRSRDGGHSWTESVIPGLTNDPHAVLTDGKGRLLIVGPRVEGGKAEVVVLHSDDSGNHWVESLRNAPLFLRNWGAAGSVDSELIIWSMDSRVGRVYFNSRDGGRNWSGRHIALWQPFRHVVNLETGRWVALSVESDGIEQEAVAWISADGGATWSASRTGLRRKQHHDDMGYNSMLISLGNDVLIAHAGGGRIARSNDGGLTWQLQAAGLPDREFRLGAHCADGKGLVVLAGEFGLLARSLDFGTTWQPGRMVEETR